MRSEVEEEMGVGSEEIAEGSGDDGERRVGGEREEGDAAGGDVVGEIGDQRWKIGIRVGIIGIVVKLRLGIVAAARLHDNQRKWGRRLIEMEPD